SKTRVTTISRSEVRSTLVGLFMVGLPFRFIVHRHAVLHGAGLTVLFAFLRLLSPASVYPRRGRARRTAPPRAGGTARSTPPLPPAAAGRACTPGPARPSLW